jgi:hypothetical protein
MVGSCDVKFPIRLEGLAYSHGAFSNVSCMHYYLKLGFLLPCLEFIMSALGYVRLKEANFESSLLISSLTPRCILSTWL